MNSPENHTISRSALRLLKWFCPDHLYEEIEGDLIQKFHRDVKAVGEAKAKRRLIWNVIRFFRLEILLRNTFSFELNQFSMFQNYLKTTFRHLLKSKVNFIFKLGGLTLALFSFLVIAIYVSFQLSFDKYHQDYENIYRVNSNQNVGGNRMRYATVPTGIGQGLKNQFPEVRFFSRLSISQRALIKFNDKLLRTSGFVEADTSVFNIFSFKFIQGNKEALHRPGAIVLSQSLAKDIFGDEDPINKLIFFPEHHDQGLEVSAIVEDLPANTHLQIRAIHWINAFQKDGDGLDSWKISRDGGIHLYVRLAIGTSPGELAYKVGPFVKNNIAVEEDGSDKDFGIFFQPIADIYLGPVIEYEFCRKGNGLYVYLFCCLGVFLLVIASINYLNISIVDFHFRNREVGVRKVLGALKRQIALYITLEALFLCLLGLLVSFGCLYFFFPSVLMLLDSNLRFEMVFDSKVISLVAATIFLLVGFSTTYPAYHLAFNSPVNDLRGESIIGRRSSVGKSLLIVQFIISIVCVSATLIIGNQVRYIEGRDLGYNRHNLVSLIMPENYPMDKVPVLKNELSRVAGVESISFSYYLMTGVPYFKDWYNVEIEGMMKRVLLNEMFVDHDFLKTMNVELLEGRNFDPRNSADSHSAFIVNETAVREFGWANPLGKAINLGYRGDLGERWEGTVTGVVKDFNTLSLHKKIEPVVMRLQYDSWPGNSLNLRLNGSLTETMVRVKSAYEKVLPGYLANFRIIEDMYDSQYVNERKALASLQIGTWIIVLISALGVFSLSIYLSAKRLKEFGIRKVLGATVRQITTLHTGYFLRIALLANVLALPMAWWLMKSWLDEFAYRTELNGIWFLFAALISFLLVIISSGYSAWKAGRMNPVDVIKMQ